MTTVVAMVLAALVVGPIAIFLYAVLSTCAYAVFTEPCKVCGVDVRKGRGPALCEDCIFYGPGKEVG
jgi:hypothetical protein